MNLLLVLLAIIFWISSFVGIFYNLYRYYLYNNLATDFWNFFSKQITFGRVAFNVIFKGENKEQHLAKILKYSYLINITSLIIMIWSLAIYEK